MQIILYHTLGCHLCELAEQVIERVCSVVPELKELTTVKIDIAEESHLIEQYGVRIPVLVDAQARELGWPFDEQQLFEFLLHG